MSSARFSEFKKNIDPETKSFIEKNVDIIEQIYDLMDEKGWKQVDLARALNKKPSEISKIMSGLHNLTLKTITAIEVALGGDIIFTPKTARENHLKMAIRTMDDHLRSLAMRIVANPMTQISSERLVKINAASHRDGISLQRFKTRARKNNEKRNKTAILWKAV